MAILVGWGGLIPCEFTNLGLKFAAPARGVLLKVFLGVVVYYTFAFIIYSLVDYLNHRHEIHVARVELRKQRGEGSVPGEPVWRLLGLVIPTSVLRSFLDFWVPVFVAGFAIWSLCGQLTVSASTDASADVHCIAPTTPPSLKTVPVPATR